MKVVKEIPIAPHRAKVIAITFVTVLLLVLGVMFAIIFLSADTVSTGVCIGYHETSHYQGDSHTFKGGYKKLNGIKTEHIDPVRSPAVYLMEIETVSGSVSVEIKDEQGHLIFEEKDIQNGSFEVILDGPSVVTFTGNEHKGSFSFTSMD